MISVYNAHDAYAEIMLSSSLFMKKIFVFFSRISRCFIVEHRTHVAATQLFGLKFSGVYDRIKLRKKTMPAKRT